MDRKREVPGILRLQESLEDVDSLVVDLPGEAGLSFNVNDTVVPRCRSGGDQDRPREGVVPPIDNGNAVDPTHHAVLNVDK